MAEIKKIILLKTKNNSNEIPKQIPGKAVGQEGQDADPLIA